MGARRHARASGASEGVLRVGSGGNWQGGSRKIMGAWGDSPDRGKAPCDDRCPLPRRGERWEQGGQGRERSERA